ncbi:MAG: hypothetical protein OHK0050_28970 [Roseiflexaceae bacterium]
MDDELSPPDDIPAEEWATWPLAARVLVTRLLARVQVFEQRLNQTSQNSNKPPSSDPPSAPPRPQKPPRGRQRGGQPGHPGNTRERREPDTITALHPTCCPTCQAALAPTLPDACPPRVLQSWNLPRIRPIITDFVQHTVACPVCATPVTAELPPGGADRLWSRGHGRYRASARHVAPQLPCGAGIAG